MNMPLPIRIGIAGWALRREHHGQFGEGDSHLARYATKFNAVEINSSFYRPHRLQTYERWRASVPRDFRFAVKMPRTITHEAKLQDCAALLGRFLGEIAGLEEKLGPILVQLPPSQAFHAHIAESFFDGLRQEFDGLIACEPRHKSWFGEEAESLFLAHRVARVAADPSPVDEGTTPGGWTGLIYYRLHGNPRIYYSRYEEANISDLAARLRQHAARDIWCIFDNTALGHATGNAFELLSHFPARLAAEADIART